LLDVFAERISKLLNGGLGVFYGVSFKAKLSSVR